MPFGDRLPNLITPQRVYALCKLVKSASYTREDLKNLLEPESLNESRGKFDAIFNLAIKGGLIESERSKNQPVIAILSDDEVHSMKTFRKAVAKKVFERPDLSFCKFTSWYLAQGEKVFAYGNEDLVKNFDYEINPARDGNLYNDTNLPAWKNWVVFLGYGFLHDSKVISNVAVRLQDLLETEFDLTLDMWIPMAEFVKWLNRVAPEMDYGEIFIDNRGSSDLRPQHFSAGLSAGLRYLHDIKVIELSYQHDTRDIWYLNRVMNHEINFEVSQIKVKGDK